MILRSIARRRFWQKEHLHCLSIQSQHHYSWLLFLVAGAFLVTLLVVWTHIWNMRGSRNPFEGRTCFSRMLVFSHLYREGNPLLVILVGVWTWRLRYKDEIWFLHFGFVWHGLKEKRLQWSFDKAHSLRISIVEGCESCCPELL